MIRFFLFFFSFFHLILSAIEVDFDYVFVGSGPISILEALHKSYQGSRVLIIEEASRIGGAWKTIDICGVSNVDMGCHLIGINPSIQHFLEKYVGCHFVPMHNPYQENTPLRSTDNGIYFSQGCFELVNNLSLLLQKSSVTLLLNQKLEGVFLDFSQSTATVRTRDFRYTTSKLVATPYSHIHVENFPSYQTPEHKFHHLYLLIESDLSPQFTYQNGCCSAMSRMMNLTPFCPELKGTRFQLIAIQTQNESYFNNPRFFVEELKKKSYLSQNSYLHAAESYTFLQSSFNLHNITRFDPKAAQFFDMIHTHSFLEMSSYIESWKKTFKLFSTN
ncbi:MAG: hypothetical protein L0207_00395 [Chlamydiae bacterium]|nr:hypothetical protein [Chlamydiota bacterium]